MGSWIPRCRKPWFYCMKRKVPRIRVMGSCAALPCPARPCSILLRLGSHLGLPGDIGGINLIDLSQQMLCSSESTCIKGQTGQSVSLSKRFLKGPGDSWEHWLEDVGLSWEQELGVGCTETQRNAVVLPRKLTWGDARLSFY